MKLLVGLLSIGMVTAAHAQQPVLSTEALQPLLAEAVKAGAGNPDKTIDALDKAVKARFGDFSTAPVVLLTNESSAISAILPPYLEYRVDLRKRIRKMESLDGLALADFVNIALEPTRVDDLDIEKIVVQRDGHVVEAISNTLAQRPFTNRLGATFTLHSGEVHYPVEAFTPGASVTVILIPVSGTRNIEKTLDPKTLAKMK